MRVIIYLKSSEGSTENVTYDFEFEEFRRLAADFEKFLKEGTPKSGIYMCRIIDGPTEQGERKKTELNFEKISAIG